MKLQCQVDVVNRKLNGMNLGSSKYLKSTLALGKEPNSEKDFFILLFSSVNKTGVKYSGKFLKQVFVKCLNEGKATLRFEEPAHDICIKSEPIQLKSFMRLLRSCIMGDSKDTKSLPALSNISATSSKVPPKKLIVKTRDEMPTKGFPRTLESLTVSGLKLTNFRRDILQLQYLSTLNLADNCIELLPPEFGDMPNIRELYLQGNKLGAKFTVDWRWLLRPMITKTLRKLDLSSNMLKSLPKEIWRLQELVTLIVDHNELQKLPSTIGRIGSLRYISLSDNKVDTLPCSFMHLKLEHIDISKNFFYLQSRLLEASPHTPWDFYCGNLVKIAGRAVLKSKQYYDPSILPLNVVEVLDDSHTCLCGVPVLAETSYMHRLFNPHDYFRTIIYDVKLNDFVKFECFFCSHQCFSKYEGKLYTEDPKNYHDAPAMIRYNY